MLIVLVRLSSLAFVVDSDPDYVPPVTVDEVFGALPSDHPASRFLEALLYHLWGSINLAPPFHAAYCSC
jgi:hypothetical protein